MDRIRNTLPPRGVTGKERQPFWASLASDTGEGQNTRANRTTKALAAVQLAAAGPADHGVDGTASGGGEKRQMILNATPLKGDGSPFTACLWTEQEKTQETSASTKDAWRPVVVFEQRNSKQPLVKEEESPSYLRALQFGVEGGSLKRRL